MNPISSAIQIAVLAAAALLGALTWHYFPPVSIPFVGNIFDGGAHWRIAAKEERISELDLEINEPVLGWAARLTTCRGSVATLESAVADQNARVIAMGERSAAVLAENEANLARAREAAEAAQARVRSILNRPIVGATTCERFMDVDAMILEALQ